MAISKRLGLGVDNGNPEPKTELQEGNQALLVLGRIDPYFFPALQWADLGQSCHRYQGLKRQWLGGEVSNKLQCSELAGTSAASPTTPLPSPTNPLPSPCTLSTKLWQWALVRDLPGP